MSNFLGIALVPAAVYIAFALARRYLPAPAQPRNIKISPDDLAARFGTTQWIFGISMTIVGLAFAWSTHALLVSVNRYYSIAQSSDGFRLWPQPAIWWFFPGFGAIALSWELTLLAWSLFGGREEASLYDFWNSQRAGFNCRKILRWMGLLLVLPIGVLSIFAIPMHATLRQNDIIDCGYAFSACRTYRYADANTMTQIDGFRNRDGKLIPRAGVIIDFKDGRRWSSADWGDFNRSINPALVEFLEAKTGLQLEYATTEADIDKGKVGGNPRP